MDRRRIDWKASARHAHLYAKEYEIRAQQPDRLRLRLRAGDVRAGRRPAADRPRGFRGADHRLCRAEGRRQGGAVRLCRAARTVDAVRHRCPRFPPAATALPPGSTITRRNPISRWRWRRWPAELQRRSLIVVFSDFTDPTSAELMIESIGRLVPRHLVLFVTMADEELEPIAAADPARHAGAGHGGHRRRACCASARWCCRGCASWASM